MSMKVTCMTMDPTVIREKQEARIPRPKGPITGFNYFSKTSRKRIFDEIGDEVRRGDTCGDNCFRCNDDGCVKHRKYQPTNSTKFLARDGEL